MVSITTIIRFASEGSTPAAFTPPTNLSTTSHFKHGNAPRPWGMHDTSRPRSLALDVSWKRGAISCRRGRQRKGCLLNGLQLGEEVHLERTRELRRRPEGYVDVTREHLRHVRPRNFHPFRERRLRKAQGLHPKKQLPQKRRTYPVYRFHAQECNRFVAGMSRDNHPIVGVKSNQDLL